MPINNTQTATNFILMNYLKNTNWVIFLLTEYFGCISFQMILWYDYCNARLFFYSDKIDDVPNGLLIPFNAFIERSFQCICSCSYCSTVGLDDILFVCKFQIICFWYAFIEYRWFTFRWRFYFANEIFGMMGSSSFS